MPCSYTSPKYASSIKTTIFFPASACVRMIFCIASISVFVGVYPDGLFGKLSNTTILLLLFCLSAFSNASILNPFPLKREKVLIEPPNAFLKIKS